MVPSPVVSALGELTIHPSPAEHTLKDVSALQVFQHCRVERGLDAGDVCLVASESSQGCAGNSAATATAETRGFYG